MILKRKNARSVRRNPPEKARLSPRLAGLVRESRWLLIVAAFAYLALILATYHKTDPAWSFSGNGDPVGNKGGVVGAWLADLLLYLFGVSACPRCGQPHGRAGGAGGRYAGIVTRGARLDRR